jgi:class 3 adenylate cyclase
MRCSAIQAKLRESGHPPVEVRVGVNTGEVVMRFLSTGDDGRVEYAPVGHSIRLAVRMQAGAVLFDYVFLKLCTNATTSRCSASGTWNILSVSAACPRNTFQSL